MNSYQPEGHLPLHNDPTRYFPPEYRHNGGWMAQTPPSSRRELPHIHSSRQRPAVPERKDPRRFSYIGQPLTPYLGGAAESQTHGHLSSTLSGDLPTSTSTTPSSSPPTSYTPLGTLDLDDRSSLQGSWDRRYCGTMGRTYSDDSGVGSRHRRIVTPNLNLSRISSDSGYSTCSSSSLVSRSSSVISDGEDDMMAWFGSRMNLAEEETLLDKAPTDHFSYLMVNEKEYLDCLRSMLKDYQNMNAKTPSLIRQHFDLIFKQVKIIYTFQEELQHDLRETSGQPDQLARVFTNERFECYGRYMVMMPAVQRDLLQFASHFKEHFPDLKRNILKPSLRINFYAMILDSFKKEASEEAKSDLQSAIDYLNQVKRKANTEMTLKTVVHSPVDLRLGGDMLHIGELNCTGGGILQKKKYQLILFENLLVITSMKTPYFKYKTHYRVEQLESAIPSGDNELYLNVLSDGQTQLVQFRFRAKTKKMRDDWINELKKITKRNIQLNQGKSSINLSPIPMQQFRTLPLDLLRVFPLIKDVLLDDVADEGREKLLDGYSLPNMTYYEEKYVNKLSALLNPEIQGPPEPLCDLLAKLYSLHIKHFLPALQRSQKVSDFLDYLTENLDELSVYTDYLVIRSQLTMKLDDAPQAGPYICPVQHIYGIYFGFVKELSCSEKCKKSAQRVIKKLQEDIRLAQLRILKDAIVGGRVDFHRSGKLLLYSRLEVKTRKKEVRDGEYIVLLFEKVIILTKLRQPYYEYVMDIWLDQVNLGPPASHDRTFMLEVRQGGKKEPITYEMVASSIDVKRKWHEYLHQQMLVQVKKIRESCVRS